MLFLDGQRPSHQAPGPEACTLIEGASKLRNSFDSQSKVAVLASLRNSPTTILQCPKTDPQNCGGTLPVVVCVLQRELDIGVFCMRGAPPPGESISRVFYWMAIVTVAGSVLGPPGICNWIGTALPLGAADGIVKNTR